MGILFLVLATERFAYQTAIFVVGEALELDPSTKHVQKFDKHGLAADNRFAKLKRFTFGAHNRLSAEIM